MALPPEQDSLLKLAASAIIGGYGRVIVKPTPDKSRARWFGEGAVGAFSAFYFAPVLNAFVGHHVPGNPSDVQAAISFVIGLVGMSLCSGIINTVSSLRVKDWLLGIAEKIFGVKRPADSKKDDNGGSSE